MTEFAKIFTHFLYLKQNRAMLRFTQHTILFIGLNMFKPKLEIAQTWDSHQTSSTAQIEKF
jgi:hypothetical protein